MKNITTETQITQIFTEEYSVFLSALRASVVKIKLNQITSLKYNHETTNED